MKILNLRLTEEAFIAEIKALNWAFILTNKIYFMQNLSEFKEGVFFIDGFEEEFKGLYLEGNRWNGWQNPYFELEEAKKVLACQDTKENCLENWCSFYEFNEDFSKIIQHYEEGTEVEPCTEINGKKYFAIGYFNWVWVLKTWQDEEE